MTWVDLLPNFTHKLAIFTNYFSLTQCAIFGYEDTHIELHNLFHSKHSIVEALQSTMVYSMNFDIFHSHGHFSQTYESYDHMNYNILDGDMLKIIKATNSKTVLSIYM